MITFCNLQLNHLLYLNIIINQSVDNAYDEVNDNFIYQVKIDQAL